MTESSRRGVVSGVGVLLGCLLLTLLLASRTNILDPSDAAAWANPYDHHKYVYMAEHALGSFHIQPPCWRIGVPLLVHFLPWPTILAFKIQTVGFVSVSGALLFWFLRSAAGYTAREALLGLALYFSYGPATKLLIQGPYSPDPASFAILLVALWCLYKRKDGLLLIVLALGVLVKETLVLVIPLIYSVRATRLVDFKLAIRTALIGAPAVVVLLLLRALIPAYNDVDRYVAQMGPQLTQVQLGSSKGYPATIPNDLHYRAQETPVNIVRELTTGSGGLLWILPFFALEKRRKSAGGAPPASPAQLGNRELALRFLPFLGLTYVGFLVALNFDRRLAFAFPFLIVMGLNGLRRLAGSWNVGIVWFVPVFALQYSLNLLQPATPAVPFDLAATVFFVCLGLIYSVREKFATIIG